MKSFEALAVGVIAGLVVSAICCDTNKKPCKPPPCKEEKQPCMKLKPNCTKCYYQRYCR